MNLKGMIFDLDGTLVDSMGLWWEAGKELVKKLRNIEAHEELPKKLFDMTVDDGMDYMKETYHISESTEEMKTILADWAREKYMKDVLLKEGVREFLDEAYSANIPMVIATSSDLNQFEPLLDKLDIRKYFKRVLTCTEIGAGKSRPPIFLEAMKIMDSSPEETVVFEDALYSSLTAKEIGCKVVGIFDYYSLDNIEELKELSDIFIQDFREITLDSIKEL